MYVGMHGVWCCCFLCWDSSLVPLRNLMRGFAKAMYLAARLCMTEVSVQLKKSGGILPHHHSESKQSTRVFR
jgi:hypothetical protein